MLLIFLLNNKLFDNSYKPNFPRLFLDKLIFVILGSILRGENIIGAYFYSITA